MTFDPKLNDLGDPVPWRMPVEIAAEVAASPLLDQLDEARAKGTPGPWVHNPLNGVHTPVGSCVATTHRHNDDERRADAALIVAEHNAIPKLTAAIRAVEAECDALDRDADGADDFARDWKRLPEGRDRLRALADERRAAADRIRAALAAALTPGADTAGATA